MRLVRFALACLATLPVAHAQVRVPDVAKTPTPPSGPVPVPYPNVVAAPRPQPIAAPLPQPVVLPVTPPTAVPPPVAKPILQPVVSPPPVPEPRPVPEPPVVKKPNEGKPGFEVPVGPPATRPGRPVEPPSHAVGKPEWAGQPGRPMLTPLDMQPGKKEPVDTKAATGQKELQDAMQQESRKSQTISNASEARHDAAKNAINNVK